MLDNLLYKKDLMDRENKQGDKEIEVDKVRNIFEKNRRL